MLRIRSNVAIPAFSSTTTSRTDRDAFSLLSMVPLLLMSATLVSSSMMVAMAVVLAMATAAPEASLALVSSRKKDSAFSTTTSLLMGTRTVCVVTPGAKLSVPKVVS